MGPRGLVEALGLFAFPRRIGADARSVGFRGFLVNRMKPVDISEKWKTPESKLQSLVLPPSEQSLLLR